MPSLQSGYHSELSLCTWHAGRTSRGIKKLAENNVCKKRERSFIGTFGTEPRAVLRIGPKIWARPGLWALAQAWARVTRLPEIPDLPEIPVGYGSGLGRVLNLKSIPVPDPRYGGSYPYPYPIGYGYNICTRTRIPEIPGNLKNFKISEKIWYNKIKFGSIVGIKNVCNKIYFGTSAVCLEPPNHRDFFQKNFFQKQHKNHFLALPGVPHSKHFSIWDPQKLMS